MPTALMARSKALRTRVRTGALILAPHMGCRACVDIPCDNCFAACAFGKCICL